MESMAEEEERRALRERLGPGARYDSRAAPQGDLALARLGTAYFARKLNEMTDEALSHPSLVPGWKRRHVVAAVGFEARRLARIVEAARCGRDEEFLAEPEAQNEDVDFGATLPDHALRYLFKHSEVHLNVEWRDLDDSAWQRRVTSLSGLEVPVRDTPWLRAREIWMRAVDLGCGGSYFDFPPDVTARLIDEVAATLSDQGLSLTIRPTDKGRIITVGTGRATASGRASDLLRWLTGRGKQQIVLDGEVPEPAWWSGFS